MMTLRELLAAAGFKGSALDTAVAVARAESGGNAAAHNGNAGTGDDSYGLFQINMLGSLGPARRAQYGLASNDALLDPATNARVAYAMSGAGANWSPWSAFKSGAYRAFLGTADTAVSTPTATGVTPSTTAGSAQTVGLPGIPDPSAMMKTVVRVVIIGTGVATGAALVLLGLNKAAGNPAGKAAKAAATVAI